MNPSYTKYLWLLPVALALIVNYNVLQNGFGWDDETIIDHLKPRGWQSILFSRPDSDAGRKIRHTYYRPLISASYKTDLLLWGKNPFGFHLSVWLAHALNTLLVFFLARKWMENGQARGPAPTTPAAAKNTGRNALRPYSYIPLIAASLFAVHPVHAEAVAWIAGRNDVYCTLFLLLSFVLYPRPGRPGKAVLYGLSMFSFVLALLAKEAAVFFFILYPLYDYLTTVSPPIQPSPLEGEGKGGGAVAKGGHGELSHQPGAASGAPTPHLRLTTYVLRSIPPLAVLGTYLALRASAMQSAFGGVPPETIVAQPYLSRGIAAAGYYLRMMILPYPHRPFITALPDSAAFIGLSALAIVLLTAVFVLAVIRRDLLTGMSLSWTAAVLGPAVAVTLMRVTPTEAAERYVYGASVGCIFLAVGWIAAALRGLDDPASGERPVRRLLQGTAGLLVVSLIVAWGLESRDRNRVWSDTLSFWQAATADDPDSGFPFRELGIQYTVRGKYGQAEGSYRRAIRTDRKNLGADDPAVAKDLNSLGALYYELGRFSEAGGMYGQALDIQQKGLEANPLETAETLNNLGNLSQTEGNLKAAAGFYRRAIMIREAALGPDNPDVAQTLNNLGALEERLGEPAKAEANYKRALGIREKTLPADHPDIAEILNNLGALYYAQGRLEEAEALYRRAVKIYESRKRPVDLFLANTLYNLAALYDTEGRYGLAEPLYHRSLSILGKLPGDRQPALATVLEGYSAMLRKMNRTEEADQLAARAREIRGRNGG
jgi:tetratricopeptide (TPR) repeat protein